MGNRATFVFEQEDGNAIYLYGHWAGDGMMDELAQALDHALPRIGMGDETYATRICVSQLTRDYVDSETGWGLSTYFMDAEHSVPVVNFKTNSVRLVPYNFMNQGFDINAKPKFVMSIPQFIHKFAKARVGV
jgi:hypothetical protein